MKTLLKLKENLVLKEVELCGACAQSVEVLEIAGEFTSAIHDACYVFLAQKLKTQLVTADNKLCEAAKGDSRILHFEGYS
jgi:predicted nucleic acid-binding protein